MKILNRPKDDGQTVVEVKSAAQKRYDKQEDAKKAEDKAQAKAVMDVNRQARR